MPVENLLSDEHSAGKFGQMPPEQQLPTMRVFHDIIVAPTVKRFARGMLSDGGPIWPNWEARVPIRHHRLGRISDRKPPMPLGKPALIERPCVWCGFAVPHFGHLIADHLTRVLHSLRERPNDLFLFVTRPGDVAGSLPEYFWSVLDWYGLPRDQVMCVTEPLLVKTLRVVPMSEQAHYGAPRDEYLDLLDRLPEKNNLESIDSDVLYVSRAGLLPKLKGGHAGESYLVERLEELGVAVLDPAVAPLREQLSYYLGAKVAVFAEGSAIHGRQLLGRLPQKVVILIRRPDKKLGLSMLTKRCTELLYADATARFVGLAGSDGKFREAEGISFYNIDALHLSFLEVGVDLISGWSQSEYQKARNLDAFGWLASARAWGKLTPESEADILKDFLAEGIPVGEKKRRVMIL